MIQARHLSFNIDYGTYIKPLEDALGKDIHFGKGNYLDIGKKIHRLSKKYRYYTEADHSTFDAHVTPEMLQLTHTFYQSCYYHDRYLGKLSKRTINNNCATRDGIKYKIRGTRMSGDVDTSLGNSLINYAILKEVMRRLHIKGDAIVNGDDSILFTDQPLTEEFSRLLREYNMETQMKPSTTNIHTVEFCRTKLVINANGTPTMMIDPKRLFQIFGMTYKLTSDYIEFLRQVICCNIACNMANPLYFIWADIYTQVFGELAASDLRIAILKTLEKKHRNIALKNLNSPPTTPELNQSMHLAHGDMQYIQPCIKYIVTRMTLLRKIKPNSQMLNYVPISTYILVHHRSKTLTIMTNSPD